jgi:hypothetical protein
MWAYYPVLPMWTCQKTRGLRHSVQSIALHCSHQPQRVKLIYACYSLFAMSSTRLSYILQNVSTGKAKKFASDGHYWIQLQEKSHNFRLHITVVTEWIQINVVCMFSTIYDEAFSSLQQSMATHSMFEKIHLVEQPFCMFERKTDITNPGLFQGSQNCYCSVFALKKRFGLSQKPILLTYQIWFSQKK